MDIGSGEILLILLVALLIYGGRLPEVARALGRSLASLKKGLMESTSDVTRTLDTAMEDADEAADAPARPRTVKRIQAAPAALATEDISGVHPPGAAADAAGTATVGPAAANTADAPPPKPQG